MKDIINKAYMENNYNCAESTLYAANEKLDLGLPEDAIRLVSGFGGGMASGRVCGALAGAIAAISRVAVSDRGHTTPDFKDIMGGYVAKFVEAFGSTECSELRPKYAEPEIRCKELVEANAQMLEEYLLQLKNK